MPQMQTSRFHLTNTMQSGQFFRHFPSADGFEVITHGRSFHVQQIGNKLVYHGTTQKFLRSFLGLTDQDDAALDALQKDELIAPLLHMGIRIMRQDPWECTAAFILSSNSNIKRITRNVEDLSRLFGSKIDNSEHKTFPRPEKIRGGRKLASCKLGYRESYLRAIKSFDLDADTYAEAMAALQTYRGIGEKIADCVCLFSLGHHEAFPVDVWIKKAMHRHFGLPVSAIKSFARERWGKYAGYAQQYLYHWIRTSMSRRA